MRTSRILIHSTSTLGAVALVGAGLVAGATQEGPQATRAPQPPVTYPADQIKAGEPLYVAYCGFCHGRGRGFIRALDYQTGKVRWDHPIGGGSGAGVLTTTTGITFTGDGSGNALALRTSDGATLWHAAIGGVNNSPVTIEIDGRQHLLIGGGSALYAWRLPIK